MAINIPFEIPKYWAKRFKRLTKSFVQSLIDSAKSEPITTDKYGEYRVGVFLHGACIVEVKHDDNLWAMHIMSEQFISLQNVKEIRYKFIPDNAMMFQFFPPREECNKLKGILLYEMPGGAEE